MLVTGKVAREGGPRHCLHRPHRPRRTWSWSHDEDSLGAFNQYFSKGVGIYQESSGGCVPTELRTVTLGKKKKVTSI